MNSSFDLQEYKKKLTSEEPTTHPFDKYFGRIYLVANFVNDKVYVGQTTMSIKKRFSNHKNKHHTKHSILSRAIQKYGAHNFFLVYLDYASTKEELNEKEVVWIHRLSCITPNGYNIMAGPGTLNAGEYLKKVRKCVTPWNKGLKLGVNMALAKPIIGTDPNGTEHHFLSAGQAERELLGFSSKHINACCLGKRLRHKNWTWRYK